MFFSRYSTRQLCTDINFDYFAIDCSYNDDLVFTNSPWRWFLRCIIAALQQNIVDYCSSYP